MDRKISFSNIFVSARYLAENVRNSLMFTIILCGYVETKVIAKGVHNIIPE